MALRRSPRFRGLIEKLEGRICFSTFPPVSAPSSFSATALSSTSIRLDFVDNSTNETKFVIERTTDFQDYDVVGEPPKNSHTFTDLNVDPLSTYTYRIRARASNADSRLVYSSPVTTPGVDDFATLGGGQLTVYGTLGDDVMLITVSGSNLVVNSNGATRTFPQSSVQRIQFYGLDGNDRIVIGAGVGGASVSGGTGNDTITGNTGGDRLDGGDGDDVIRGADGNDTLLGGNGRDRLFGDAGNDLLDGGNGNDVLHAGLGNDTVFGGNGLDRIFGEGGIDSLVGGRGDDIVNP